MSSESGDDPAQTPRFVQLATLGPVDRDAPVRGDAELRPSGTGKDGSVDVSSAA